MSRKTWLLAAVLRRGRRLRFSVELLNALNGASPWAISYLSGPTFGQISNIDQPRIVRGSVIFNF